MSIMKLDSYSAKIEYDEDLGMFRGEILGLNGGADFYGKSPEELKQEFRNSLEEYLRICKEKGISPHKEYSGKFNLRIPPELHSRIAVLAASEDKSLNQWVAEKLEKSLAM